MTDIEHIKPRELQALLASDNLPLLIDVREQWEHDEYDIGGVLIPLGELMNHVADIPDDKPVVLYCKKGVRSLIAIQRLQEKHGFTNLINLEGGIENYKRQLL